MRKEKRNLDSKTRKRSRSKSSLPDLPSHWLQLVNVLIEIAESQPREGSDQGTQRHIRDPCR